MIISSIYILNSSDRPNQEEMRVLMKIYNAVILLQDLLGA